MLQVFMFCIHTYVFSKVYLFNCVKYRMIIAFSPQLFSCICYLWRVGRPTLPVQFLTHHKQLIHHIYVQYVNAISLLIKVLITFLVQYLSKFLSYILNTLPEGAKVHSPGRAHWALPFRFAPVIYNSAALFASWAMCLLDLQPALLVSICNFYENTIYF